MNRFVLTLLFLALALPLWAGAKKDVSHYETRKNFYNEEKEILTFDVKSIPHVRDPEAYGPVFHFPPIRQDTTGTCWCFAATSLLEAELERLGRGEIQLSRMFTVYWEYVEKVRRYVRTKGESLVAQGSQLNAVIERMKQYGTVRASDYTGLTAGATVYDHKELFDELTTFLDYVKENNVWHENQVIANVRMILDRHIGAPPETITVDGKEMSPKQYMEEILQLPLEDYVSFISFKKVPFWTQAAYDVPDNWWKSEDYYNVPLQDFYGAIKSAIKNDYSVAIAGDVSEPGKYGWHDIAAVPTFDIPPEYIDQDSREFRFDNSSSTDDHGVHLIGYKRYKGEDWFLVKDSAASAWRGDFDGYHFFHGDYLRLKILAFMVHKDAVTSLLEKYTRMQQE